jgi:hypothetical protein
LEIAMGAIQREKLPKDLVQVRSQFEAWRKQRKAGGRIPRSLWALAVRLVSTHGISRTAAVLGVDYSRLKKQTEAAASQLQPSGRPTFVELPSPVVVGKQCLFELVNRAGASMRVQLMGYDTADVETLARSFWNAK